MNTANSLEEHWQTQHKNTTTSTLPSNYLDLFEVKIMDTIAPINWLSTFSGMGPEEMTTVFTNEIYSIVSAYIPNKVVKFNDKDPSWITMPQKLQ